MVWSVTSDKGPPAIPDARDSSTLSTQLYSYWTSIPYPYRSTWLVGQITVSYSSIDKGSANTAGPSILSLHTYGTCWTNVHFHLGGCCYYITLVDSIQIVLIIHSSDEYQQTTIKTYEEPVDITFPSQFAIQVRQKKMNQPWFFNLPFALHWLPSLMGRH